MPEYLQKDTESFFSLLRWRARRGILENDLWLTAFLRKREEDGNVFSEAEMNAFNRLLDLSDDTLFRLWTQEISIKEALPALSESEQNDVYIFLKEAY